MTSIAADSHAASCCRRSGIAVAVRPASAFAQGQCGGARAGTPECDPTPAKLPFAADGLEDRPARSLLLPGRGLPEGGRLLRRAHELEDSKRRRHAGGARHRRLGRPGPPRRISGAAAAPPAGSRGAPAAGGRAAAAAVAARPAPRGIRRFLLGHRAVGRKESGSGTAEARAHAGRRQPAARTSRAST